MIRVAVRCEPAVADEVLAELLELAPGGVEEDEGPGWVEYAIYGAPGELPEVGAVEAMASGEQVVVTAEQVPDDWADRWRDFHRPVRIGERVVIRPSWEEPIAGAGLDVVIDPGQAFGTGAHPTTRMCVELLIVLSDAGEGRDSLVDLGSGSGVLAIVAAKLGFDPVTAIDHEPAAIEAIEANAEANGVAVVPQRVNLRSDSPPFGETVVANLTTPLLRELAERLAADPGNAPRRFVCSGLLAREANELAEAFARAGYVESERRRSGEWGALALGLAGS
jgi:ribosomal protein L11 methyltransferase